MSTTVRSRLSSSLGAVERHHPAERLRRLGLRQLHHLVAVEHEVPAPLADPHQPAHPRAPPAAPPPAPPAPPAPARSAPSPAISGRSGRRSRLSTSATRTPFWSRSSSPSGARQTTTGTRSTAADLAGRRSAAPAPARARPRRAPRSARAPRSTSSSRLEAGSRTKAATRICSARSRLTSGHVDRGDGELRPLDDRLADLRRPAPSPCPRRSYCAITVQVASTPASIGTPKLTTRRKPRPEPQPVQPVAQPRRRRVAAGGDLHREHEASSTIQRTSAPKRHAAVRRLLRRQRGRRHPGLGVGLEEIEPGEPARARPSGSRCG